MGDTVSPSPCDWFHQFYDQTITDTVSHDQAINSTMAGGAPSGSLLSSPSCSTTIASGGQLTPKVNVSKPIRRRSRVSKKTPITLLTANTSNFRSLVQQFTGYSRKPTSLRSQKGPINLNFQLASVQNRSIETTTMAPYSYGQYYQQQQYAVPFQDDYVYNFSASGDDHIATVSADFDLPDELFMGDISFQEIAREALAIDNASEGNVSTKTCLVNDQLYRISS